jgi:GntR family transcriptional regulator of arabinose operon
MPVRTKRDAITEILQRRVAEGVYQPNGFLPSERALAAEFGVSRPTLRNAIAPLIRSGNLINQAGLGTRVAGNGDPRSNGGRQGWKILALILPDIANRVFLEFTEAIEYTALQRGYHLLLCNSRHQGALEEMHIRQLVSRHVDGIILAHDPNREFPAALASISEAGIPAVFLFSAPPDTPADAVLFDEAAGVDQAMRYLFSLGHRRIAFCRPVAGNTPHPREMAFIEFLNRAGVKLPPHFLIPFESIESAQCRDALQKVFSRRPAPSAIFAGNDRVALILLTQLTALGFSVPRDISIVGFDNQRLTEHLPVPLTTVDQPKQEMGRRAVELLIERIEMGTPLTARREVFQPHLIIRDSCGLAN